MLSLHEELDDVSLAKLRMRVNSFESHKNVLHTQQSVAVAIEDAEELFDDVSVSFELQNFFEFLVFLYFNLHHRFVALRYCVFYYVRKKQISVFVLLEGLRGFASLLKLGFQMLEVAEFLQRYLVELPVVGVHLLQHCQ